MFIVYSNFCYDNDNDNHLRNVYHLAKGIDNDETCKMSAFFLKINFG